MALSEQVRARVLEAGKHQSEYAPSEVLSKLIGRKTLLMFVAPAAVGKTFIMDKVAEERDDFRHITSFTTRSKERRDAPGLYNYIENNDINVEQLLNRIDRQTIIQYAVHPTTGFLYGSMLTDYRAKYNMLDTLSGVVQQLQKVGFEKTITYGVVSEPDEWIDRFNQRYPHKTEERFKRIKEGRASLKWLIDQEPGNVAWIENSIASPNDSIQRLIDVAEADTFEPLEDLRSTAERMYEATKGLE